MRSALLVRHRTHRAIRKYFDTEGFLEVDTPQLIDANCVEAYIDPLHVGRLQLHTSPEAWMKRILAKGVPKIFQLSHVFRDESEGPIHRKEFTLLEWYRSNRNLEELVADCETLFTKVAKALGHAPPKIPYERLSVAAAFSRHAQIDLTAALEGMQNGDPHALARAAQKSGMHLRPLATFEDVFVHIMLIYVEPRIGIERPAVLHSWPAQLAPLSERCPTNSLFSGRFEIYAGGMELANAFQELGCPKEQKKRFEQENKGRSKRGGEQLPLPKGLLRDLTTFPKAAGIAVGVERMMMYLLGTKDYKKVRPF